MYGLFLSEHTQNAESTFHPVHLGLCCQPLVRDRCAPLCPKEHGTSSPPPAAHIWSPGASLPLPPAVAGLMSLGSAPRWGQVE